MLFAYLFNPKTARILEGLQRFANPTLLWTYFVIKAFHRLTRKEIGDLNTRAFTRALKRELVSQPIFPCRMALSKVAVYLGSVVIAFYPVIECQFGEVLAILRSVSHRFQNVHEALVVERWIKRLWKGFPSCRQIQNRCKPA